MWSIKVKNITYKLSSRVVKSFETFWGGTECNMRSCHYYDNLSRCEKLHSKGSKIRKVLVRRGKLVTPYWFCVKHTKKQIEKAIVADMAKKYYTIEYVMETIQKNKNKHLVVR